MSNRLMKNRVYTNTGDLKVIHAKVTFGASGAPTLAANPYVKTCAGGAGATSTGVFKFTFGSSAGLDTYYKFVGASVVFDTSGVSGGPVMAAAPFLVIHDNQSADGAKAYVTVGLYDGDTPAVTDPADGTIGYFEFKFGDSSAP